MVNLHSAQRDLTVLHPAIREAVAEVERRLNDEGHPFKVFEAYRSPQRQQFLFGQGRTRPGRKVTWVNAWGSYHQYGLAADFVLFIDGKWSWSDTGKWTKSWKRLHEIGAELGLEPISKEMPHLQIRGVSISDLKAGRYPESGDAAWAENLEGMIAGWGRAGAPPPPSVGASRPQIEAFDVPQEEDADVMRPASPGERVGPEGQFARVHAVVEKWEGGFANHPLDRGGPTNMGITMDTLARWRGRTVSVAEVRALGRDEAWRIMKHKYYDVVRGDDLPLPVALAAHNAAVLHGPKRSGEFLQKALISIGLPVEFDGIVGDETAGAAGRADPAALTKAFFEIQRDYFREIERTRPAEWAVFGRGWMNRFHDIAATASKLAGREETTEMIVPEPLPDRERPAVDPLSIIRQLFRRGTIDAGHPIPPDGDGLEGAMRSVLDMLGVEGKLSEPQIKALVQLLTGTSAGKQLTQVNAALGETIGKLLDGRKTALGIIGTLLLSLIEPAQSGLAGTVFGPILTALGASSGALMPITLALLGWGLLGKIDKWVKLAR